MNASLETDSSCSWVRLAIIVAVGVITNAGMWAIVVILSAVEAEFGTTRAEASVPYTLNMAGFALGNLAIGRDGPVRDYPLACSGDEHGHGLGRLAIGTDL